MQMYQAAHTAADLAKLTSPYIPTLVGSGVTASAAACPYTAGRQQHAETACVPSRSQQQVQRAGVAACLTGAGNLDRPAAVAIHVRKHAPSRPQQRPAGVTTCLAQQTVESTAQLTRRPRKTKMAVVTLKHCRRYIAVATS